MEAEGIALVKEYLHEVLGLKFRGEKEEFLERKIKERINELGLDSPFNYYLVLKHREKEAEIIELILKLNLGETYFYREEEQLLAFRDVVLKEVLKQKRPNDRSIRIWSAGCSTGEEPYTLAILLREKMDSFPEMRDVRLEIIASDVNRFSLNSARVGKYNPWSIRHLPERYLNTYIFPQNGGYVVPEEIRDMVKFIPINLNNVESWTRVIKFVFDIIFCRNVLMYFSDDRTMEVIKGFYKVLNRGGYLFSASAESLTRHTDLFKTKRIDGSFVYKKNDDRR